MAYKFRGLIRIRHSFVNVTFSFLKQSLEADDTSTLFLSCEIEAGKLNNILQKSI